MLLVLCGIILAIVAHTRQSPLAELEQKRVRLIQYIFKEGNLPASYPDKIDPNYTDSSSRASSERYTVRMRNNITSEAYLYLAENKSENLMIVVGSHDCDVRECMAPEIAYFLGTGYSVLAISLPAADGDAWHSRHYKLAELETGDFSPISYFVEPVARSLNYAIGRHGFSDVAMTGFSGGGWLTVLYSALDTRVQRSYPVAGSLPRDYREEGSELEDYYDPALPELRKIAAYYDYEQALPALYSIANYYDLYLLGASPRPRSQVQILNLDDSCCFKGRVYLERPYAQMLGKELEKMGGGSIRVVVLNLSRHEFSPDALALIR